MTTALGSLFRFVGLVCCRFDEEMKESAATGVNFLTDALPLFPHWQALPHGAELPECLNELKTAVRALVKEADTAAALKPMNEAVYKEYQRLFLAPELPVPLWESVWRSREKLLFTEETSAVRAWYRKHGLEIQQVGHEAEDHVGLELFFVGWLLDQQLTDEAEAFLCEHAGEWIPACCQALYEQARTPFWKALFRTGETLITPLKKGL